MMLRDVMDHAVEVERENAKRSVSGRSRRPTLLVALLVPALAFAAWSWIARPEIIWGPRPRQVTPERQEADTRFSLFLLARRIDGYRRSAGAFPPSLDSISGAPKGVAYRLVGDSAYEISANGLTYRSGTPVAELLSNAPRIIAGPGK
jgi:hypothetical protein